MTPVPKSRNPELVNSLLYLYLPSCPPRMSERLTRRVFNLDTFHSCIWCVWFPAQPSSHAVPSITKHRSGQSPPPPPPLVSSGPYRLSLMQSQGSAHLASTRQTFPMCRADHFAPSSSFLRDTSSPQMPQKVVLMPLPARLLLHDGCPRFFSLLASQPPHPPPAPSHSVASPGGLAFSANRPALGSKSLAGNFV